MWVGRCDLLSVFMVATLRSRYLVQFERSSPKLEKRRLLILIGYSSQLLVYVSFRAVAAAAATNLFARIGLLRFIFLRTSPCGVLVLSVKERLNA